MVLLLSTGAALMVLALLAAHVSPDFAILVSLLLAACLARAISA